MSKELTEQEKQAIKEDLDKLADAIGKGLDAFKQLRDALNKMDLD